jgi:hypothetical protein
MAAVGAWLISNSRSFMLRIREKVLAHAPR